jgi:Tol biopolymer transport system component
MRAGVVLGIVVCAAALASECAGAEASAPSGRIVFVTNRAPTLLHVVRYAVTPSGRRRRVVVTHSPEAVAFSRDGRRELVVGNAGSLFVRDRSSGTEIRLTPPALVPVPQAGVAFSPNGKQIAFTGHPQSYEFVPYHVYVANVDGTQLRDIATGLAPSWSEDGKLIAYGGDLAMNTSTTVDVVRPDGTGHRSLGRGGPFENGDHAVWSPDGHRLAYSVSRPRRQTLVLVDADGRDRRTVGGSGATHLVWSPHGRMLAFNRDGQGQLLVVRANGRGLRRITANARSWEIPMAWSPRGDRLVVARGGATGTQLVILPVPDRRFLRRLTHEQRGTQFSDVRWSRRSITYDAYLPANDGEVAIVRASGGGFRILTQDGYNEDDPVLSPDGRRVAFARDDGNNFWLFTMRTDGSDLRRLSPPGRRKDRAPAWSPDGKRIAFVSYARSGGLVVMNADGTELRMVTNMAVSSRISWSPDGQRLAFAAPTQSPSAIEIFTVSVDGTDRRQVTHLGTALAPRYSPDGSRILFNVESGRVNEHDLATIRPDGTRFHPVALSTTFSDGGDWSPDGTRIVFARGTYERSWIVTADADGGGESIVTNALGRNVSPSWLR